MLPSLDTPVRTFRANAAGAVIAPAEPRVMFVRLRMLLIGCCAGIGLLGSALPSQSAAAGRAKLAGQLSGVTIPVPPRGIADIQAIRADTGVISGTRRLRAPGLYEMTL